MSPDDMVGMVSWACSDCGNQLMTTMSTIYPSTDAPDEVDMTKVCIDVNGVQCAPKFVAMITVTSNLHGHDDNSTDDHGDDDGDDGHDGHDHGDDGDDDLPELTPELIASLKE